MFIVSAADMALSRSQLMVKASIDAGKSRRRGLKPREKAEIFIRNGLDQDGFEVRNVSPVIGRGVFATKYFECGDFLLEYVGERLDKSQASMRQAEYIKKKFNKWYMFHFRHADKDIM